jgi:hypothetical protein
MRPLRSYRGVPLRTSLETDTKSSGAVPMRLVGLH